MSIQSITTTAAAANSVNTTGQTQKNDDLQTMFQQILIAQLKTQDPLDPMDNSEFLSQMAELNSLQQLQNLNTLMSTSQKTSQIAEASLLIGRVVTGLFEGGTEEEMGIVDSVQMENGTAYLMVGPNRITLNNITKVTSVEMLTALASSI
ncbi:MAG: hypothetical protein JW774_12710 [Candidatus Aureabacteria bacterium]|nr:hypothetical protein [Candidatus Auribacterota bacterium]